MDNKLIIGKNEQMSEARRAALTFDIETMPDISQPGEMKIQLSVRGAFILELSKIAWNENADPDLRAEADKAAEILSAHVRDVKIIPVSDKKYQIEFEPYPDTQDIRELVELVFRTVAFNICFQSLIASPQSDGDKQAKKRAPKTQLIPKGAYPLAAPVVKGLTGTPDKGGVVVKANQLATVGQLKMEHVLLSLLSQTSIGGNPKDPTHFGGNIGFDLADMETFGENFATSIPMKTANTQISVRDLFREWGGGKKLGGKDKAFILKTLSEYEVQMFELCFESSTTDGRKILLRTKAPRVQVFRAAVSDAATLEAIKGGDVAAAEKFEVLILKFHPVFAAQQMGSQYSNTPEKLHQILEQAAGGGKSVTAAHYRLYHYFSSIAKASQGSTEIYEAELLTKAGFDSKGKHIGRDRQAVERVLGHLINAGLLESYSKTNSTKGPKYTVKIKRGD